MTIEQIIRIFARDGIGSLAVIGGIWLLFYLVRHTVVRYGILIDKLSTNMDKFQTKVEMEHKANNEQNKEILAQHKEITDILKSINNRVT